MPETEIDELADNFFCHLHDHGHHEHHDNDHDDTKLADLINSLNPLNKLRKSILENRTIFILNENHLDLKKLTLNETNIICSKCNFKLGYKRRNKSSLYNMWKSNVTRNETQNSYLELLQSLKLGRYILETKSKPHNYIYLFILSNDYVYKKIECNKNIINHLSLNELINTCKFRKIMYKFGDKNDSFLKQAENNDFNLSFLNVSEEHFDFIFNYLKDSTESNFCFSLKQTTHDNYYFALA